MSSDTPDNLPLVTGSDHNWSVTLRQISENELYDVTIFGTDRDDAVREAIRSFMLDDPEDFELVAITCLDTPWGEEFAARELALAAEVLRTGRVLKP